MVLVTLRRDYTSNLEIQSILVTLCVAYILLVYLKPFEVTPSEIRTFTL